MASELANEVDGRRFRVVQWATGNVGSRALRKATEQSGSGSRRRVGAQPGQASKDAGERAGMAFIGVKAINSAGIRTAVHLPQIIP